MPRLQCPVASVFVTVVETETKQRCDLSIFQLHFAFSVNEIFMFNFLASQIPGPIFCTPASLGHASVTSMSIGNLQYILLHDIHNLLCDLILKHESTSPEFVWGFQCSLLGSKIHYLGQEKSNSLDGSTQVVNIHYLGQIHNLGQSTSHFPDYCAFSRFENEATTQMFRIFQIIAHFPDLGMFECSANSR